MADKRIGPLAPRTVLALAVGVALFAVLSAMITQIPQLTGRTPPAA